MVSVLDLRSRGRGSNLAVRVATVGQMLFAPWAWATQPSILKWSVNRVPACLAGVKAGCLFLLTIVVTFQLHHCGCMINKCYVMLCVFTCVGWQVTLCDSIWQVTFRSCVSQRKRSVGDEMKCSYVLYNSLTLSGHLEPSTRNSKMCQESVFVIKQRGWSFARRCPQVDVLGRAWSCLLYTSPSPRD